DIAAAPVDAGDVGFPGEPDPGYVPAAADDVPGEVLTGEVEPSPADDAPTEMVLEPVDDDRDDAALPVVDADAHVVDAELVEDPDPELAPDGPGESVQLTSLRADEADEDAEVVDDHAGPPADAD
ncbi:large membrane associated protein, partial [Clavibacter lycopersici]